MDFSYTTTNNILIDLVRVKGKFDLEFKQLESIIKESQNTNIDILYDIEDDIRVLTNKYAKVRFIALEKRNHKLIVDTFITGNYKLLFGMYLSSISVKEAIKYIKEGVIPIISSLPSNYSSYIDNIVELYDEVLKPLKDKHNINEKLNKKTYK